MSVIEHFTYEATRAELRAALDNFRPGHMVFLIGPSGAGKTTLRHAVMQEVFGNPRYWGKGRIPAIETISMLPNNAFFNSRELAKDLREQLHVPSLRWLFNGNRSLDSAVKEQLEREVQEARTVWSQLRSKPMTEGDYWRSIQWSLPARGCKLVSVEQANGLLKNRRNTLPADHTLHLLSVAENAGVMFIMTGVPECIELWAVHHELRRRVIPVWFRPYSANQKEDHNHYLRLLKTLSTKYNLSRPDLLGLMAYDLLAATGGLLGHLISVMETARSKAAIDGSRAIKKSHIKDAFYSDTDLSRVWKDVHEFEAACRPGNVTKRSAIIAAEWAEASADEGTRAEEVAS